MVRRLLSLLICILLLAAAGCSAETGEESGTEGVTDMTEFQRSALTATGNDPENFDLETAKKSVVRMLESAAFAESYLASKYPDVEFRVESFIPAELMQTYDEFRIVTVEETPVSFTLRIEAEEEGSVATDNYYGILHTSEYEEMIADLIETEAGIAADVSASVICMLGAEFNHEMPVLEAAVRSEFFAYTWVLLSPATGDFDASLAKIRSVMEEKGLGGEYTLFLLIEPLPEGISREEEDALILSHKNSAPVWRLRESFTVFAEG